MIETGLLMRSSRMFSNLVMLLMPLTLIVAIDIVLVESSRLGDDCNGANRVGVVLWYVLVYEFGAVLLLELLLLLMFWLLLLFVFLLLFLFVLFVLLFVSVSLSVTVTRSEIN